MDDEQLPDEQQDEQPRGPVVRVPSRVGPVEAPAEAASHWDERIWRQP
ncbi:hypothetical protein ACFW6C_33115 [Streptomyces fungicidicus]